MDLADHVSDTQKKQRKKETKKWGQAVELGNQPPVMGLLQPSSTSYRFHNLPAAEYQVFQNMSLWGT